MPAGFGDSPFSIIFILFSVFVVGMILYSIIKGLATWSSDNAQPILTADAKVATKRTEVHGGGNTNAYSNYYVTFEMADGDRVEFKVKGAEYGQLVEGDCGELQSQGTRYHGFVRQRI
ncbi:DUF2500 domain-containing protein [Niallia sp. 03133]|uniref:DUF2500 domain-containing protein n=1 Tax=Niallia sp. 03133 TaxID=3458060 RepID=UPI004044E2FE